MKDKEKGGIARHGKPDVQLAPQPERQVRLGGMQDRIQLLPGCGAQDC